MEIQFYNDFEEFYNLGFPFLMKREVENALLHYLLGYLKQDIHHYGTEFPHLSISFKRNSIVSITIQTPPNDLLISYGHNIDFIEQLVDKFTARRENIPGILALDKVADEFAKLWSEKNNVIHKLLRIERLYVLRKVNKETIGNKILKAATAPYQSIVLEWARSMLTEALEETTVTELERTSNIIREEIKANKSRIYLVFDKDTPVSMARKAGKTPNGNAINLVYTPPLFRRKGYATECVAQLSQKLLEEGSKFCFLFTDLSNPISNSIYQKIGYEPIHDLKHYKFYKRK